MENADAIAAIDGVDCLWVGHFDLSVSLGVPGDFGHPAFTAAIDKVRAATSKHDKALGRLVPTVEQGVELFAQGFDFICYSGDVWVLHNALAEAIGRLRAGLQVGGGDHGRGQSSAWRCRATSGSPTASPTYPDFDLEPLQHRARHRDGLPRVRPARSAPSSSRTSTR